MPASANMCNKKKKNNRKTLTPNEKKEKKNLVTQVEHTCLQ